MQNVGFLMKKLICVFVFAYAKRWFSHDAAHLFYTVNIHCLLGYFACFCHLLFFVFVFFLKLTFSKRSFWNTISVSNCFGSRSGQMGSKLFYFSSSCLILHVFCRLLLFFFKNISFWNTIRVSRIVLVKIRTDAVQSVYESYQQTTLAGKE